MNKDEELISGIKFETSELDFIIGADTPLTIPPNKNSIRHFYNQNKFRNTKNKYENTMWSCGLFANMGAISDLTGYLFTDQDILAIHKSAIDNYGLVIGEGMYINKAVNCVRNYYNTVISPHKRLLSFRCEIGDATFRRVLTGQHSLVIGYKTSTEYHTDSQDDGKMSKEDYPKGGGHLVRTNLISTIKIDDNYLGWKKYNTYENNHLIAQKNNGVFFPSAYFYLYNSTDMDNEIRNNIDLENAKSFFDRGYTNGLNPKNPITRQELWAILEVILQKNNLK